MISSTGEILTNNHVISGATSITVKIAGTGTAYKATVVGYDVAHDVAVLQIANVSGLKTIATAGAATVSASGGFRPMSTSSGASATNRVRDSDRVGVDDRPSARSRHRELDGAPPTRPR